MRSAKTICRYKVGASDPGHHLKNKNYYTNYYTKILKLQEESIMLYPILTESRLLSDLSGVWDFKLDNGNGFDEKWYEAPLKDADTMPVPASYNDLKEGADFRDHYGWVFYQRNISVPSYVKSQRIVLRCAAVTHYAKIYLNGNLICEHKGGFFHLKLS